MFFSVKTQGFYVGDALDISVMPDDCITVTGEQEEKIRDEIMRGNYPMLEDGGIVFTNIK